MALLTKAAILSVDDQRFDVVACPEWGGEVRVRGLTAYEQSVISKLVGDNRRNEVTIKVVQFGCVDENGDRLFDAEDLKQLSAKSYTVIERLGRKIYELTGFGNADEVEDAKKN